MEAAALETQRTAAATRLMLTPRHSLPQLSQLSTGPLNETSKHGHVRSGPARVQRHPTIKQEHTLMEASPVEATRQAVPCHQ